jgi:hypothetical protein
VLLIRRSSCIALACIFLATVGKLLVSRKLFILHCQGCTISAAALRIASSSGSATSGDYPNLIAPFLGIDGPSPLASQVPASLIRFIDMTIYMLMIVPLVMTNLVATAVVAYKTW